MKKQAHITEKQNIARCEICGSTKNVTFAPDPYACEIAHDNTKVYECDFCRRQSADEI